MLAYVKDYSLDNLKNKLIVLYVLNVTDIVFTLLLLNTGYYIEANTLMNSAVQNYTASFCLKVLLPAILLLYIFYRLKSANVRQLKNSNIMINGITAVYAFINLSHLVWFSILPIFIMND
ncbi:MAG TPA: hypothetical protein GXX18_16240 [Bacillales bacterium]|nr:hypothetical protein [Bacillales bacterium]